MDSLVLQPGWAHTRPSSTVRDAGGRWPGRVPFIMPVLLRLPIRRRPARGSPRTPAARGGSVERGPARLSNQRADPLEQLRRHLVAAAPRPQQLLQPSLEVRVIHARRAPTQVLLDLDAQRSDELAVEVELDLLEDLLTVNRRQGHAPVPSPTTPSPRPFFRGAVWT